MTETTPRLGFGEQFQKIWGSVAERMPCNLLPRTIRMSAAQLVERTAAGERFRLVAVDGWLIPRVRGRRPLIHSAALADFVDGHPTCVLGTCEGSPSVWSLEIQAQIYVVPQRSSR